jgi:hypothetical protein
MQTIPESMRNQELDDIIEYFRAMLKTIDSSLLDEWERLKNPEWVKATVVTTQPQHEDPLGTLKTFTIRVRNEVFRLIRMLATQDYEDAVILLSGAHDLPSEAPVWTSEKLQTLLNHYFESGHTRICTDTKARHPKYMTMTDHSMEKNWQIQQVLVDPDHHNDWIVELTLNIQQSRDQLKPILILNTIREI